MKTTFGWILAISGAAILIGDIRAIAYGYRDHFYMLSDAWVYLHAGSLYRLEAYLTENLSRFVADSALSILSVPSWAPILVAGTTMLFLSGRVNESAGRSYSR